MLSKRLLIGFVLLSLITSLTGCNLPSRMDASSQPDDQTNAAANTGIEEPASELPPEATPEPVAAQLPEFDLADLCSIVSPAVAEQILGQPVEAVEGPGACLYSNGTASITISALDSDAAKLSLASQILQLDEDCSMSFSYSSDQPDPTPLPPEADPLLAMSLPDLMEQSLTLQQSCGGPAFETLTEYGSGVYLAPFDLFMPGGQISIVTADYSLSILYTDINADAAGAVEVARQMLEMVAAGQ